MQFEDTSLINYESNQIVESFCCVIHCLKFSASSFNKASLLDEASSNLKTSIELASEKGALNWITILPLQEHNFSLHKSFS